MGKETKHSGTAHGKIILIGEHSVVHFKPAIALPLMSTEIRAEVSGNGSSADDPRFAVDCEYFTGSLADAPGNLGNLQKLVTTLFNSLCVPQGCGGFDIKIISSIPRERGMGSSAAVAIAVIRAVADYAGVVLGSQEVFDYAQISENIAHENASGLDTIATASNQAVWFERGETAEAFDCECPGTLIVADSGVKGGTREAVAAVRSMLYSRERGKAREAAQQIDRLGELAYACLQALRKGDTASLGFIMDEAHEILTGLTVSDRKLDTLVAAARKAGAIGAKLTGGGRGGCMITLVADDLRSGVPATVKSVESALKAAGAVNTWRLPLHTGPDTDAGWAATVK